MSNYIKDETLILNYTTPIENFVHNGCKRLLKVYKKNLKKE